MNEILESLVGKTLNLPNEKVAEFLYSDAEKKELKPTVVDDFLRLDAERVTSLKKAPKEELTAKYNEGYNKAKAEALSKFEKEFKEAVGFQSDLIGIDLVKAWAAEVAKSGEIDEQKLKLHPRYIELERKLANEYMPKAEYDKVKAEYDAFKQGIDKEKILNVVIRDAQMVFRSLKPILPKDPQKATNQERDFLAKLSAFDFQLADNGEHVVMKDGKRVENDHAYAVSFKDFIQTEANKYFEFEQQEDKGNAGNNNDKPGGSGGGLEYKGKMPKDEAEYMVMLANEKDLKVAAALMEMWKKRQK